MDANIVFKVPSSNKLSTEPNKNDVATNPFHRESKDAGIPAPTYATRVWVVCSVFAACIANEDGVRMKTTSTALHDVRLNQIVRCAGVKFSSFFQHLTKLQDVFPNLFQHHLDQVSNFKLQGVFSQSVGTLVQ